VIRPRLPFPAIQSSDFHLQIVLKGVLHHPNPHAARPLYSRDHKPLWLRLAQLRLNFGSGLLTLLTRRVAVLKHLVRNCQVLAMGPKTRPPRVHEGS
jgi:hypothetical protein